MSYQQVLAFTADIEAQGLVSDVTIGGSVSIILHAEPIHTDDLDFFVHIDRSGLLVDLGPIYQAAVAAGATVQGEYLAFGASKFQFIVAATPLEEESMSQAEAITAFGIPTRVLAPEYIIAMKLSVGRPKDRVHISHLLRTARTPVDLTRVEEIASRHGLTAQWHEFLAREQP